METSSRPFIHIDTFIKVYAARSLKLHNHKDRQVEK